MRRFRTSWLTIALFAQVLLCLVAAPVIATEQREMTPGKSDGPSRPSGGSRSVILAAYDASNVRPEEVADAEQKRGNARGGCKGRARIAAVECPSSARAVAVQKSPRAMHGDFTDPAAADPTAESQALRAVLAAAVGALPSAAATIESTMGDEGSAGCAPAVEFAVATPPHGSCAGDRLPCLGLANSAELPSALPRWALPAIQPTGPPAIV